MPRDELNKELKLEEVEAQDEDMEDDNLYSIKLKLSDEEKKVLAKQICAEIKVIVSDTERVERIKDFDDYEDEYKGVVGKKAALFDGASDFHPYLGARHVNRVRSRIRQQLFLTPMWIIDPTEPADVETLEANEKLLDWVSRVEMKIEKAYTDVLEDTCKLGTGVMKVTYFRKKEWFKDLTVFEESETTADILANMDRFVETYGNEGVTEFPKIWNKIERGQRVSLIENYEDYSYKAPKAERIPLKDFVFTKGHKELEKCRLVGQKVEMYWTELKEKEETEGWENIDSLKEVYEDGEWKPNPDYQTEPFECYEVIYKYQDKNGKTEKGVFVVALKNEEMLNAIAFPYFHNRCYYVPFYIKPDENSFYGTGLVEMVRQISRAEKRVLDILIDAGLISNIPAMFLSGAEGFAPFQSKFYPGKIYSRPNVGSRLEPINIRGADAQLFTMISHFESIAEQQTSASYGMSGKESPLDPRAPASKTMALLQEANIGIAEYIDTFQLSNAEVGYLVGQLVWQFMPEEKEYGILGESMRAIPDVINREQVVMFRANFRPHGSTEVSNKAIQHSLDLEASEIINQSPVIQAEIQKGNLEPARAILEITLSNMGGNWDKHRERIIPPAEEMERHFIEVQKQAMLELQMEQEEMAQRGGGVPPRQMGAFQPQGGR